MPQKSLVTTWQSTPRWLDDYEEWRLVIGEDLSGRSGRNILPFMYKFLRIFEFSFGHTDWAGMEIGDENDKTGLKQFYSCPAHFIFRNWSERKGEKWRERNTETRCTGIQLQRSVRFYAFPSSLVTTYFVSPSWLLMLSHLSEFWSLLVLILPNFRGELN